MSLESMKQRLSYSGGAYQQDRMIVEKRKSMLSAIKHSYQAARFTKYPEEKTEVVGLFNPVTQNENFDTKMISTEYKNNFKVGDIFKWCNTGYYWIVFQQDRTELAYFRGECRRVNYKTNWVDKDRNKHEALLAVIGPTATQLRTSSSMQAKIAEEFPNANLSILTTDNPENRAFFTRYQKFLLKGTTYMVENIDNLSMPGVIQIAAYENYSNLIEDDVEQDLRNAWNVKLEIADEHKPPTVYGIIGPDIIKPGFEFQYTAIKEGGDWLIVENHDEFNVKKWPVEIMEDERHQKNITVKWIAKHKGAFTLAYRLPEVTYQKYIIVESLM